MRWTQEKLIFVFFALSAFGSWAPLFWFARNGASWQSAAGHAVAVWYAFPPMLAALFISGAQLHQPVLKVFGLSLKINRWWWLAWLLPLFGVLLGFLFLRLAGEPLTTSVSGLIAQKRALVTPDQLAAFDRFVATNPPPRPFLLLLWALPAGITLNMIPSLAEEMGFRGFLFREVPGNFWPRSLAIGLLWALWLTPASLTGMFGDALWWRAGLVTLTQCLTLGPLLVYIRARADSLIAVAIFRGTLSALATPAFDIAFRAPLWLRPTHGLIMPGVWLALLGLFALHERRTYPTRLLI